MSILFVSVIAGAISLGGFWIATRETKEAKEAKEAKQAKASKSTSSKSK